MIELRDIYNQIKKIIDHVVVSLLQIYSNNVLNCYFFRDIRIVTSCDISTILPRSTILKHPVGIVISRRADIGKNVAIYGNVIVGSNHGGVPEINDGVTLYSNSVVIGDVSIGKNAIIGANSTVLSDVPPNAIAVGSPAEVIKPEPDEDYS